MTAAGDAAFWADLIERAGRLSTCQLSDALDRCGLRRGGLPGIHPMEPARPALGRAFTVDIQEVGQASPAEGNYLDQLGPGDFVVLAARGRIDCSVWGGNRTIAALRHGAVAAVADGAYRDVEEHRAYQFPVYGLACTPMAGRGHVTPTSVGAPVVACGVRVEPGDLVAADSSGVVVVPWAHAGQVVARAESLAAEEAQLKRVTVPGQGGS